jgi:hypothetical protein
MPLSLDKVGGISLSEKHKTKPFLAVRAAALGQEATQPENRGRVVSTYL